MPRPRRGHRPDPGWPSPGFPIKSTDPLPPDDYPTAALGEHNAEVLGGLLRMTDERLAELEAAGVIASKLH